MSQSKIDYAKWARAESGGDDSALGDSGRALGLWQMHNEYRKQWYTPICYELLKIADRIALDRFVSACEGRGLTDAEILGSFHLHGVPTVGCSDPAYVERYEKA